MSALTATLPSRANLRFQCGACHSLLEVPVEFAGVTAPCPFCGNSITAPEAPPVSEAMPTQCLVPAAAPPRKEKRVRLDDVWPETSQPRSRSAQPPVSHPDIRDEEAEADPAAEPAPPGKRRIATGPNLPKILGWASVALSVGAAGFLLMIARYSVPVSPKAKEAVIPRDLTTQVLWQKDRMEHLRSEAITRAVETVQQFLKQGAGTGTGALLRSFAAAPPQFDQPLYPDLDPASLATTAISRKPGTDDFVATVEPTDGRGPVFIVEQSGGTPEIHADALVQQADDLWTSFLTRQDSPPVVLYVSARPFNGQYPLEEIEAWPKIDVTPPFPQERPQAFVACAAPGSEAARVLINRPDTAGWGRLVVELRWSRTPAGKPFIEIVRVLPSAWSRY